MILPQHPSLAWSLSFWLAANLVTASLLASAAALLTSPVWALPVIAAGGALAAVGLLRPDAAARPYAAWNALAAAYARLAREWILRVCFFVLIFGASRTKANFRPARPAEPRSSWEAKSPPGIETCSASTRRFAGAGWMARYLSWSRRSGNLWAGCLLPFICLLKALETKEADSLSERLYTLY